VLTDELEPSHRIEATYLIEERPRRSDSARALSVYKRRRVEM